MARQAGSGARGAGWWSTVTALVYVPLVRFLGVLAVAIVALVLGGIGLEQYLTGPHAAERLRPQLLGTSSSTTCSCRSSAPPRPQGPGPYPVPLGIARILAPVGTFLAAVGTLFLLLGEQWRPAPGRRVPLRHAIVAGDGPVALKLAGNLLAEKRKLVLFSPKVVLVSSDDETLTRGRQAKLLGYRGDPSDPVTLRAARVTRAAELYACTGHGTVNAAIALRARDEVPASRKQPLRGYAQVRDAELGVALRARRIGVGGDPRLRLDFFAVEDIAARRLFDKHPIPSAGDSPRAGGDQRLRVSRPGGPARGRAPAPGAARSPAGRGRDKARERGPGREARRRLSCDTRQLLDHVRGAAGVLRGRRAHRVRLPRRPTTTRSARAWPWPTRWSAGAVTSWSACGSRRRSRESSPLAAD